MARTSSRSNSDITRLDLLIIAAAVLVIAAIYLLVSQFTYAIGFPLDDTWIHQTYARNLAMNGEWAFRTGLPSAGSTSPLWSALLALGFLLNSRPTSGRIFSASLLCSRLQFFANGPFARS